MLFYQSPPCLKTVIKYLMYKCNDQSTLLVSAHSSTVPVNATRHIHNGCLNDNARCKHLTPLSGLRFKMSKKPKDFAEQKRELVLQMVNVLNLWQRHCNFSKGLCCISYCVLWTWSNLERNSKLRQQQKLTVFPSPLSSFSTGLYVLKPFNVAASLHLQTMFGAAWISIVDAEMVEGII